MESAIKSVVYAPSFYNCPTKKAFSSQSTKRATVLYEAISMLADAVRKKSLNDIELLVHTKYQDSWFAYDYVRRNQEDSDIACIKRFVNYVSDATVLSGVRSVSVETPHFKVFSPVSFIAEKNGVRTAYVVFPRKADKSFYGKSVHTNSETDVFAMTVKAALEHEYPGINVALVYLFNSDDTLDKVTDFRVNKTQKSNIFEHDFSSYYDECHVFSFETFLGKLDSVLSTKVNYNCFVCDCKDLCQQKTLDNTSFAKRKDDGSKSVYEMPQFTKSQMEVIRNTEGPMLVCAGPGSGKTATLVGRIHHLIESGVDPEFILAITFSRDAAKELKDRCLSFCKPYEIPEIMTLNALGYQLLRLNPEYVGEVNFLSTRERFSLINSLLEATKPLTGFDYSVVKGPYGLLNKVDKALSDVRAGNTEKYGEDFLEFANTFSLALSQKGYINFEEQITMAQKMFEEHPDVLDKISSRYKYIMVDEFQDIDATQARFIYSLTQKFKNICAVGDDDQSIYSFRGGSNEHMLSFRKTYPGATIYTLKENFRSTESIVKTAEKVISGNKRISKDAVPVKKGGIAPMKILGQDAKDLDAVVIKLLEKGYGYGDIAVIASKNNTLQALENSVSFPSVLGKEFVISNPLFKILLHSLKSHYDVTYDCLPQLKAFIGNEEKISAVLNQNKSVLAINYVETTAKMLGLEDSAVMDSFETIIGSNHVSALKDFYELLVYMADFEDDTRVEPDTKDAVIFITSHESKGMEWKVVLMIDDYRDDVSEEQNRLIYVAMTRSKELLYVFEREGRDIMAA